MSNTTETGNRAEQAVADYLTGQGYEILELNWKTKYAEIDVVAQKDKTLYFVEVKYRRTLVAGDGFDYITKAKLRHMRRAAESYVLSSGWMGEYILMAASVTGAPDGLDIEIIEV